MWNDLSRGVVAAFLAIPAVFLVVVGRLIHLLEHPEWTEAEAFLNLWAVWSVAAWFLIMSVCAAVWRRPMWREKNDHLGNALHPRRKGPG